MSESKNDGRVKVVLPTPDGATESLWARDLGDGRFELDNVPFRAEGVSLGDIVTGERVDDGYFTFSNVVVRGGHSTYHVMLAVPTDDGPLVTLRDLGCGIEHFTSRWKGVDVPPGSDVVRVFQALEDGMASGAWTFDERNFEHRAQ